MKILTTLVMLFIVLIDVFSQNTGTYFIENKGQWDNRAKYFAPSDNAGFWLTADGLVMDYRQPVKYKDGKRDSVIKGHVVKMSFAGAIFGQSFQAFEKMPYYHNYFLSKDSTKWASRVGIYKETVQKNVYDGIDIRYYVDNGSLRYDFIVNPGADPSAIQFQFKGADGISIEQDKLIIKTSVGEFAQSGLYAYQEQDGKQVQVQCSFAERNGIVQFKTSQYDKNKQLVIDPLVYSTYLRGLYRLTDAHDIAVANDGYAVVCGSAEDYSFPTTEGAYQTTRYPNTVHAYISKINKDGSNLIFSTFFPINLPRKSAIEIDDNNDIYLYGGANRNAFPFTQGSYLDSSSNKEFGIAVIKLSADGSELYSSCMFGGSSIYDESRDFKIGKNGNIYLFIKTKSNDFPTTKGCYQEKYKSSGDCAITILNPDLSKILYSTYLGSGIENDNLDYKNSDVPTSILVDKDDNVIVLGNTYSEGLFPITEDALMKWDTTAKRWNWEVSSVFITKFDPTLSKILYSSYLSIGIDHDKIPLDMVMDNEGNIIIIHSTTYYKDGTYIFQEKFLPTSENAYTSLEKIREIGNQYSNYPWRGVYICKLSPSLKTIVSASYFGCSSIPGQWGVMADLSAATDKNDNIFIAGELLLGSTRESFPSTNDAFPILESEYEPIMPGRSFITVFNSQLTKILYSTIYGGSDYSSITAIDVDQDNHIFVCGDTFSEDLPISPNAFIKTVGNDITAFISCIYSDGITSVIPEKRSNEQLNIYPNPANSLVYVSTQTSENQSVNYKLFNYIGIQISSLSGRTGETISFDVSHLPQGVYFIRAETELQSTVKSFVVER